MKNNAGKTEISESETEPQHANVLKDTWSIRPCNAYKDEYDDCTSIKARFHQYFIHGQDTDCSQWKIDYDNCIRYQNSNSNNLAAGEAVIKSEELRRNKRLQAHYNNTTWRKRTSPPTDWSAPLPEWMEKRNEGSYLLLKQKELEGSSAAIKQEDKSFCVVM